MCGRYAFYSAAEAAAALFGAEAAAPAAVSRPRYNIAPTQDVLAVRQDGEGHAELAALRWGLTPFWAKDRSMGNRLINARVETAATRPAYREAWRRRRCLVLADGFYEWRAEPGGKIPWYISLKNGKPFAFAGLWERWRDREANRALETAAILTRPANEFLARLHDRMPVVLEPEDAGRWLAGEPDFLAALSAGSLPGDPEFRAWPVDRRVNNAANEGPELIRPPA